MLTRLIPWIPYILLGLGAGLGLILFVAEVRCDNRHMPTPRWMDWAAVLAVVLVVVAGGLKAFGGGA